MQKIMKLIKKYPNIITGVGFIAGIVGVLTLEPLNTTGYIVLAFGIFAIIINAFFLLHRKK
jgi:hypothetical protein